MSPRRAARSLRRLRLDDVAEADVRLEPLAAALATKFSCAVVVAGTVVAVLAPGLMARAGWLPLAVGLAVGLPHGAVDHLVAGRVGLQRGRRIPMVPLLGAYVAAAAAFFAFARVAPDLALGAFVLVSIVHFGAGDVAFAAQRAGRTARFRAHLVVGAGATPVLFPLALWPERTRPVVADLAPGLEWLLTPGVRWAVIVVTVAAVLAAAVQHGRDGDRLAAAEVVGLAAAFAITPPLVAFGAYFGGWHAVRHVARLLSTDPVARAALQRGRAWPGLVRFARQAIVPTVLAVSTLGVLWWGAGGAQGFVAANLGLLAALTMPHVVVVSGLDGVTRHPFRMGD